MKLLVVGASGFIGRSVLLGLRGRHEVVAIYNSSQDFPGWVAENGLEEVSTKRCDFRKEEEVAKLLASRSEIDECLYLASDTRVGALSSDPSLDVANNILPVANFAKHYNGGPVVFFSSGAVYMGQKGLVSHTSLSPTIPYSISKLAAEHYLMHAARTTSYECTVIRFFGAYGPGEPERKITRKLLSSIAATDSREVEFTVYGDGKNLIDVVYVDDAVSAIGKVLKARKTVTVDLCGEAAMPINEYVTRIGSTFGKSVKIRHEGDSPEYIRFHASNRGFARSFGAMKRTPLERGLARYMAWLKSRSA